MQFFLTSKFFILLQVIQKKYQGELFLKLGDLSAAQQNLARLEKLCLANCKEFAELKRAIADFTATRVGNRGS